MLLYLSKKLIFSWTYPQLGTMFPFVYDLYQWVSPNIWKGLSQFYSLKNELPPKSTSYFPFQQHNLYNLTIPQLLIYCSHLKIRGLMCSILKAFNEYNYKITTFENEKNTTFIWKPKSNCSNGRLQLIDSKIRKGDLGKMVS